jgi:hypothetical protein
MIGSPLGGFDDEIDGGGEAAPVGGFFFELDAAGGGEGVELGLATGFGFRPLGFDPTFLFETVQGGIERALLNLENFARDLLNALGDGPAVLGFEREGFKDEEIESALDEIVGFAHSVIIYIWIVDSQGVEEVEKRRKEFTTEDTEKEEGKRRRADPPFAQTARKG